MCYIIYKETPQNISESTEGKADILVSWPSDHNCLTLAASSERQAALRAWMRGNCSRTEGGAGKGPLPPGVAYKSLLATQPATPVLTRIVPREPCWQRQKYVVYS